MARPKTNPAKHRKNVAVTLDPDLLGEARALAAYRGRSLSQVLDDLLREWIVREAATADEMKMAVEDFIDSHERMETALDKAEKSVNLV